MKKIIAIILCLLMVATVFVSCSEEESISTFTKLPNDKTLRIGSLKYYNYQDTTTTEVYQNCYDYYYKLYRYDYNPGGNSIVFYEGYYYQFSLLDTVINDHFYLLGHKTTTKSYTFEYLMYGENNIAVNLKTTTSETYDYDSGLYTLNLNNHYYLNGYFDSFDSLASACPALAETIETERTFCVSAVDSVSTTYDTCTYTDVYYALETNKTEIDQ